MSLRCDVCRRTFRPELDRGCLAWAFTMPRGSVDRVWIVCSARCLEVLGELPVVLAQHGLRLVQMSLRRKAGSA